MVYFSQTIYFITVKRITTLKNTLELLLSLQFLLQYKLTIAASLVFSGQKGVTNDPPEPTGPTTTNAVQDVNNQESRYSKLNDEEKEKVKKIVYILDRFGVSNEAYHEFTQLEGNEGMIRSYVVEGCQADINKGIRGQISRTPGPSQGAEMSFPELLRKEISKVERKNVHMNFL